VAETVLIGKAGSTFGVQVVGKLNTSKRGSKTSTLTTHLRQRKI